MLRGEEMMNSKTRTLELKKKTTTLILKKLSTCIPHDLPAILMNKSSTGAITEAPIARMAYDRFDDFITAQHNVVVKNWPLKTFCNPSAVTSRNELDRLYNSWRSGITYFQRLTQEEMEAWEDNRIAACMEFVPPAELVPALASPQPPAEPVPAPALPQPPADMTLLLSELPRQDRLALAPRPLPNVPLAPVTNLTYGSAPLAISRPGSSSRSRHDHHDNPRRSCSPERRPGSHRYGDHAGEPIPSNADDSHDLSDRTAI